MSLLSRNRTVDSLAHYIEKHQWRNMILHASSSHPQSLIKSIPYSQHLHIHHNCSDVETFWNEAANLRNRLLQRGYLVTCPKKAYRWGIKQIRHNLLCDKKDTSNPELSKPNKLHIISKFSKQHEKVKRIVMRHWHLLRIDPSLSLFVLETLSITYRRTKSFKDSCS